jgi:glutamate-ammonia-ligase adenylyltransferase
MTGNTSIPAELLSSVPPSLQSLVANFWSDWRQSCAEKTVDPEQDLALAILGRTWACSDFVARNCIRYPESFRRLSSEGFASARSLADYKQMVGVAVADTVDDNELMTALRVLRQREMLRIAWRDLNVLAEVAVILQELTDFAEAVVAVTLAYLEKQQAEIFGMPCDSSGEEQSLLVFAMGKMGGGELNFSSDIDLIFVFAEDGETSGPRHKSHYEFYLAVIRKLVNVLDTVTVDGFVFRVDIRLRPFGESGPMAMSFSGIENYYQSQGRDWERYAMIKARLISGRESDRLYLQSMLTPFVYRRYLDFSMIESIREMKAMINAQMKRKRMINNIKLGHGGIREIEFIGQTLQLIRGGREPELRARSIIKVLTLLAEKNYLQAAEVDQLIHAYWFLRKLENRLQMLRDRQTHVLPDDAISQQSICLAMQMQSWDELLSQLSQHQDNVDRVFQQLITHEHEQQAIASPFAVFWEDPEVSGAMHRHLEALGYSEVDAVLQSLSQLRHSPQVKQLTEDTSRLLSQLLMSLIEQIASYPRQSDLLDRVSRLIKALAGRKVYISLLNEYPKIQQQMLKLCAASEWFTERLIKHPILLDSLLVSVESFRQQHDVRHLLDLEFDKIERLSRQGAQGRVLEDDLEQQMDRMRQFKRQMVFTVAVLDVFYDEPVETVSDRLTELADVLLEKILALCWQTMVLKYGEPRCVIEGEAFYPAMSIVAYGKLGGNELGYDSDLDIIFLHNSSGEQQMTTAEKSIDNATFFARVAQRVIHFLNTSTYSGQLYEVDTRLRPDGHAGLMVSSISAFESYQREKAWTWEHQALIRARFVTDNLQGNALIEQEFDRIRSSVLRQPSDAAQLLSEVVAMREKMRNHLANKSADFDIKQDAGGLVDIEFMTQAGVLIHAAQHADCIRHTATLRLISELTRVGWYTAEDAEAIANAYRYFRKLKNWQKLKIVADDSEVSGHREKVIAAWHRLMPEVTEGTE